MSHSVGARDQTCIPWKISQYSWYNCTLSASPGQCGHHLPDGVVFLGVLLKVSTTKAASTLQMKWHCLPICISLISDEIKHFFKNILPILVSGYPKGSFLGNGVGKIFFISLMIALKQKGFFFNKLYSYNFLAYFPSDFLYAVFVALYSNLLNLIGWPTWVLFLR